MELTTNQTLLRNNADGSSRDSNAKIRPKEQKPPAKKKRFQKIIYQKPIITETYKPRIALSELKSPQENSTEMNTGDTLMNSTMSMSNVIKYDANEVCFDEHKYEEVPQSLMLKNSFELSSLEVTEKNSKETCINLDIPSQETDQEGNQMIRNFRLNCGHFISFTELNKLLYRGLDKTSWSFLITCQTKPCYKLTKFIKPEILPDEIKKTLEDKKNSLKRQSLNCKTCLLCEENFNLLHCLEFSSCNCLCFGCSLFLRSFGIDFCKFCRQVFKISKNEESKCMKCEIIASKSVYCVCQKHIFCNECSLHMTQNRKCSICMAEITDKVLRVFKKINEWIS